VNSDVLRSPWTGVAALAAVAAFPLVAGGEELPFAVSVLIEVFVFAVFAMGFNLLVGYTGYVSFGHALFLGAGAYGTALLMANAGLSFLVAAVLALGLTALLAAAVAAVSFRRSGVYFAMITLAFAQIAYTLFRGWDFVGGVTGVTISPPTLLGYEFNPFEPLGYYYLCLGSVVVVYLFVRSLVRSPFGHVLLAIRENEERARAIGYDVWRFKLAAFTISGTLGGLAGVLYAAYFTQVAPGSTLYWTVTGDGLFMILIGGIGTLVGPLVGAAFVVGVRYSLSTYLAESIPAGAPELLHRLPERWPLLLGLIFVATVLYFREGIAGGLGFSRTRSVEGVVRTGTESPDEPPGDGGALEPSPESKGGGS
jgi:branched-chain amino acid transport system permease protein